MKRIILFLTLIFFVFSTFFYIYILPNYTSGLFKVEEGESLNQIAKNLKKEGYIKFGFPFYFYVLIKGKAADLKSGVYLLTSDDTIFDIADKIIVGETAKIKVTVPEGFNLVQIEEELINPTHMDFSREELLREELFKYSFGRILIKPNLKEFRAGAFKKEFSFLESAPDYASLEGFLFPDTYYLYPGQKTEEIIKVFLDNFDKRLTPELSEEIEKRGKTIFEIIIIASLIEKEVRTPEDKKLVSGILWKRLKTGMPLQVDATITYIGSYIIGKKITRVSFDDLQIDSPYNTYKYLGLPKGPISNPGLDSIRAAVYPESSDYWYYLSTPEGKTIFSKTLKEHNLVKSKYLK